MSHSRTFLFLLLLMSAACIVLIQLKLDGGILGNVNYRPFGNFSKDYGQPEELVESAPALIPLVPVIKNTSRFISSTTTSTTISSSTKLITVVPPPTLVPLTSPRKLPTKRPASRIYYRRPSQIKANSVGTKPLSKYPLMDKKTLVAIQQKSNKIELQRRANAFRKVGMLPPIDSQKVVRVILVAYFRCGSTFAGDILQQNWKTFYHFEPLHYMSSDQRVSGDKAVEGMQLIRNLFLCNFSAIPTYVKWAWKPENRFLFKRNMFLWHLCHSYPAICFQSEYLSSVCHKSQYHVMKVTRVHMHYVQQFIKENPDLNIKVVHLVRDPRGTINSRKQMDWCNISNCSDPSVLCKEMEDDLQTAKTIKSSLASSISQLKYENLSLNPELETKRIFSLLKLPYSQSVQKFLRTHTTARISDSLDPYSTRRNSSSTPFEWVHHLNFTEIEAIQNSCQKVMHDLDYRLIKSPDELSHSFQALNKTQLTKGKL